MAVFKYEGMSASGQRVSGVVEAFDEFEALELSLIHIYSEDLAPNNGLVAMRQVKGDPSSSVEVSDKVSPSKGNESKATTFTLTDTVPAPGTYEYTFLYGTTFETKTVTVS